MADKFFKITIDTKDFEKVLDRISKEIDQINLRALEAMGDELLRISSAEVPHDTGALQASGTVQKESNDTVVTGYHTPYAARLHEHPEYRFQKGRKAKYLQDPLLHNLTRWLNVYASEIEAAI